jgi:hypothetical protein
MQGGLPLSRPTENIEPIIQSIKNDGRHFFVSAIILL